MRRHLQSAGKIKKSPCVEAHKKFYYLNYNTGQREEATMTALEKARQMRADMDPDMIVKYGCPDRCGVGIKPGWCPYRGGAKLGKYCDWTEVCRNCWNQKVKEKK